MLVLINLYFLWKIIKSTLDFPYLISYASIEELESFVDISINDIKQANIGEISFKILSLKQYLKVYQTSIKDGYRVNIRQKKDNKKIELIKNKLKNTSDVM